MAVNFNLSEVSFFFIFAGEGVVIDKKNTLVMSVWD